MTRNLLFVAMALTLSACSGSSDTGSNPASDPTTSGNGVSGPDDINLPGTGTPTDGQVTAVTFQDISPDLSADDNATAELTRSVCLTDYNRLRGLLASDTTTEVFHAPGETSVDVEWIDSAMNLSATARFGDATLQRQGAGAVFSLLAGDGADPSCEVTAYETFGLSGTPEAPATVTRVDAALECAPDSTREGVDVEDVPLFIVDDNGQSYRYGRIARIYTVDRGTANEQSAVARLAVTRSVRADGSVEHTAACAAPATLADGSSVLTPVDTVPTTPVVSGDSLYLGRPWQESAQLAQDALNVVGLDAMRARLATVADTLGLHDSDTVERGCPGGGTARALSNVTDTVDERRYEFSDCQLNDGNLLNGEHDSVYRNNDDEYSFSRNLEERYSLRIDSPTGTLAIQGTVSDAEKGAYADECGLVDRELVLRIDIPDMTVGDTVIRSLAVEDIDNLFSEPAAEGGCGVQVTRHNFSDSARVQGPLGDGTVVAFTANRTGSLLRDADGSTRSSGQDAMIRIYAPASDDGLDLVTHYEQDNGATITINEYPGQQVFLDTWMFVQP